MHESSYNKVSFEGFWKEGSSYNSSTQGIEFAGILTCFSKDLILAFLSMRYRLQPAQSLTLRCAAIIRYIPLQLAIPTFGINEDCRSNRLRHSMEANTEVIRRAGTNHMIAIAFSLIIHINCKLRNELYKQQQNTTCRK